MNILQRLPPTHWRCRDALTDPHLSSAIHRWVAFIGQPDQEEGVKRCFQGQAGPGGGCEMVRSGWRRPWWRHGGQAETPVIISGCSRFTQITLRSKAWKAHRLMDGSYFWRYAPNLCVCVCVCLSCNCEQSEWKAGGANVCSANRNARLQKVSWAVGGCGTKRLRHFTVM